MLKIQDFIPNYPDPEEKNFNTKIFLKKEFNELSTSREPAPFGSPGELWNHQRLLARIISPHTNYNEMLLFHTPGTGKTCVSIAIAEAHKYDKYIRKPVIIITPNETLVEQTRNQIAFRCTDGSYIPANYFAKGPEELTDLKKLRDLTNMLNPMYLIYTLEKFKRAIENKTADELAKYNTLIIIDEAHNLRIQTTTAEEQEETEQRYKVYHRFLHSVKNCKKILLTGTPMYDSLQEMASLMNLILDDDKQLPTGKAFVDQFFDKQFKLKDDSLYDHLVGKVSYIREGGNFPKRINLGESKKGWTKYIKTVNVEASAEQLKGYTAASLRDKDNKGIGTNARQAANFVYKGMWGVEAFNHLVKAGKTRKIHINNKDITLQPYTIKGEFQKDLMRNLQVYSSKFDYDIKYITSNKNRCMFVYSPLKSGAGGAVFFGLLLELFGYEQAIGINLNEPKLRYAIITGDTTTTLQRRLLIDAFNSEQNRNGEIIQVFIATKTISEGTSFINVRDEIILSPYWNNSGTEQAISRGIRANSLTWLPESERYINVLQMCMAGIDNIKNTDQIINKDAQMYHLSERKDIEIKSGEHILKKSAIDCALNYDRNAPANASDFSRECDYEHCNYKCIGLRDKYIDTTDNPWSIKEPKKLDDTTWYIYYSRNDILDLIPTIKDLMKKNNVIELSDLYGLIEASKPVEWRLYLETIDYIIKNKILIYTRYGLPSFLNIQGSTLFISNDNDVFMANYTLYPFINVNNTLTNVLNDEIYNIDCEKDLICKKLQQASWETQTFVLEYLGKINPANLTNKTSLERYNNIMKLYKDKTFFRIDNNLVHTMNKKDIDHTATGYIDFINDKKSAIKCLDINTHTWNDCERKYQGVFSKNINSIKKENFVKLIDTSQGIYGKVESGKFKIFTGQGGSGQACSSYSRKELLDFCDKFGIDYDEKTSTKNICGLLQDYMINNNYAIELD